MSDPIPPRNSQVAQVAPVSEVAYTILISSGRGALRSRTLSRTRLYEGFGGVDGVVQRLNKSGFEMVDLIISNPLSIWMIFYRPVRRRNSA